ncbi:MAG TPA: type II toxin-antitoxin system prevent-host-death family antitoxin [Nitrospiria bacterium]
MKTRTAEVSAFEAKTHLSELLRETEQGRSFIIRRRGKAVARLVPPEKEETAISPAKILAAFHDIRKHISGTLKIHDLIEEGRRH